jgi:hypothetical protein
MNIELITEGYKSIQEWGKWLVTIETAVCAGLWPKLSDTPRPPASLYLGWTMFLGSIVTTAIMLGLVSFFIKRSHIRAEKDAKWVRMLVIIQYVFFFAGIICFGTWVFGLWAGA